ncbi:hypothetical protein V8G54_031465 [Vigna mungo]|uniref:poly(A)-specific ribonuclease n=1 Tax=Vigna mungo TaxID=3915 RepID=A0AAQ3MJR4_VIGMU
MEVPGGGSVVTRSVWASNLETEFELIRSVITFYPLISMDTEFPGVIFHSNSDMRQPEQNYAVMKSNVECLHLIQVGLTLSDCDGNLPSFQSSDRFIWEFNFREFNVACDPHASDSIALLQRQGIDLEKNRKFGVDIVRFVELLMFSGMLCNSNIQWITFHGGYDFGYLVKTIYDVKHLIKFCPNLYGGLDRVGESLSLDRAVGKSHQAGSDSLLTLHAFNKIKNVYFSKHSCSDVFNYKDVLYGLELF